MRTGRCKRCHFLVRCRRRAPPSGAGRTCRPLCTTCEMQCRAAFRQSVMCASGMNATRHFPCANGGHLGSGQGLPSPVKQPTVAATSFTSAVCAVRGQHLSAIHIQPFGHGLLALHSIVWHCIELATPCRDTVFMRHTPNQFKGTTKSRCPATAHTMRHTPNQFKGTTKSRCPATASPALRCPSASTGHCSTPIARGTWDFLPFCRCSLLPCPRFSSPWESRMQVLKPRTSTRRASSSTSVKRQKKKPTTRSMLAA